jgi:HAMP domain-containing protein
MPGKRLSLKWTLFFIILSVAMVCIVTSAVLAMVLASGEVNKRLEQEAARATQQQQNPVVPRGQQNPVVPPGPGPGGIPPWLWICFLVAGVAGLLVALGLSLWMAKRISRPLSELTIATAGIADGEYGGQVDVGGGREIEELASAVNSLSQKLKKNEKLSLPP